MVNKMEDLNYYLDTARFAIKSWGVPAMLNNEDDIASVANLMMTADSIWDGRGDKIAFRNKYAKYAIMNLIRKFKAERKKNDVSITDNMDFPYKGSSPDEKVEREDLVKQIIQSDYLSEIEKKCLVDKYLNECSLREVAANVGLSYEMVRLHINAAIRKVRDYYNEKRDM